MPNLESRRMLKKMFDGATGPLMSFFALFALPLTGSLLLPTTEFAFWALLASVSTIALSLDFGGTALLISRYHFARRLQVHLQACALSALGSTVIGVISVSVWWPLSTGPFAGVVSYSDGALAIGVMTAAALLRSGLMVIAQSALLEGWLGVRNFAMAGHAALAVVATLVWLLASPTYWALPMGWLISGILALPIVVVWFVLKSRVKEHLIVGTSQVNWVRFAALRALNTLVASLVLQGDRWVVAFIAGPHWLAVYEVAWRFAALPRMLLQALALHVSVDVASLTRGQGDKMMATVVRSTRLLAAAGGLGVVGVAVAYGVFLASSGQQGSWVVFALMSVAYTALALTAPLSIAGTTAGRASIDLPYALIALAGLAVFGLVAWHTENIWIFIVGYLSVLAISVPVFFGYAPQLARQALESRRARSSVMSDGEL